MERIGLQSVLPLPVTENPVSPHENRRSSVPDTQIAKGMG
jgi:hypothetical protein